jgi:hypothetical protein
VSFRSEQAGNESISHANQGNFLATLGFYGSEVCSRLMAHIKRWRWVLLIMELALFAIILIHPDIDLPEFTFRSGTAPITAKYRFSVSPVMIAKVAASAILVRPAISENVSASLELSTAKALELRLSLLCTLLC